jgi:hypothetical protein
MLGVPRNLTSCVSKADKGDPKKGEDWTHYEEVSVRRCRGWTTVWARWAFVGIPSDYVEPLLSAEIEAVDWSEKYGHRQTDSPESAEELESFKLEERRLLHGGIITSRLRNYDGLKILSRGGEVIHFYREGLSDSRGFARFVDGKPIPPIWHLAGGLRRSDAVFNYETGEWRLAGKRELFDEFTEDVAWELLPRHAAIAPEQWVESPYHTCYIKQEDS